MAVRVVIHKIHKLKTESSRVSRIVPTWDEYCTLLISNKIDTRLTQAGWDILSLSGGTTHIYLPVTGFRGLQKPAGKPLTLSYIPGGVVESGVQSGDGNLNSNALLAGVPVSGSK